MSPTPPIHAVRDEVRRAVIGQDRVIDEVLIALLAGGHVLLEGVPGLGKTLLARAIARRLVAALGDAASQSAAQSNAESRASQM